MFASNLSVPSLTVTTLQPHFSWYSYIPSSYIIPPPPFPPPSLSLSSSSNNITSQQRTTKEKRKELMKQLQNIIELSAFYVISFAS